MNNTIKVLMETDPLLLAKDDIAALITHYRSMRHTFKVTTAKTTNLAGAKKLAKAQETAKQLGLNLDELDI